MKIGLVGYQGSGKSTLFEWLTGVAADPAQVRGGQSAMATVTDRRIEQLAAIYHPKKITQAALEIVDTPGLSRSHEGNAARLALIREAGCLLLMAAAFDGSDPIADVRGFDEDLLLADMEILSGRIARVEDSLKKPLPRQEREHLVHEENTLKIVLAAIGAGKPLGQEDMTDEQRLVTRAFRLLSEKPRMVIVNTADDEQDPGRFLKPSGPKLPMVAVPVGLELELSRMSAEDRAEFEQEMGLTGTDRDALIRSIMEASGQMLFFTAGDKEVRSWMITKGTTAVEAAENIHTDLARGFIRAEVMTTSDLVRVGSEREIKAHHLLRQEPRDYVIQDDDVVFIRFSV